MTKFILIFGAGTASSYFLAPKIGNYLEGESALPGSKGAAKAITKENGEMIVDPKIVVAGINGGVAALVAWAVFR